MPIADNDVMWVEAPAMNLWERTFVPAIIQGLGITGSHLTDGRNVTQQYPEEPSVLPLNYRGVHRLNRDEKGRVKCVACMMCATACPAHCIDITAAEAPKDDPLWADRDKFPATFELDELKCIYCGMCEEACPCDAIELTHIYDVVGATRDEMIYDKEKLLSVFDQTKDSGRDPVRTQRGALSGCSEFASLPPLAPATAVQPEDRSAKSPSPGVISE
jgi:NADH-quinone oxidoreductase subunit I